MGLGAIKVWSIFFIVVAGWFGAVGGSSVLGGRGYLQGGSGGRGGLMCFISMLFGCPLPEVEAFLKLGGFGRVVFGDLGCRGVVSWGLSCTES